MRSVRSHIRRPLVLVSVAATMVSLVLLPGSGATAAPSPADAQRQLQSLGIQMDKINEQANSATVQLKRVQAQQAGLDHQFAASGTTLDASRAEVGRLAASAYRDGGMRLSSSLVNGSPGQFLDQMATLEWLSGQQRATLVTAKLRQSQYDDAKARVDLQVQSAARLQKDLASRRAALAQEQSKWEGIRQTLAAQQNSATTNGGTVSGNGNGNSTGGSSSPSTRVTYHGQASGNAAAVVRFALAQQGKPYVFGGAGPNTFDCSGLTEMAWAQAGVTLPHASVQQYYDIQHVARADLQLGDLVFFYGLDHVGVYIGNNEVVHAPTEGDVVKVTSIDYMPYAGAGRP